MAWDPAALERAIRAWAPVLARFAEQSPELRAALRELGTFLAALGAEPPSTHAPSPAATATPSAPCVAPATVIAPASEYAPAPAPIRGPSLAPEYVAEALRQGGLYRGKTSQLPMPEPAVPAPVALDFAKVERRARLKAEGAAFAVTRQRHVAAGGTIFELRDEYEGLRAQAADLAPCLLWMLRDANEFWDDAMLDRARRWYLNVADALSLTRDHLDDDAEPCLRVLAESQSGLRSALETMGWEDRDVQLVVYMWIRDQCRDRRIYLGQFMSIDAAADADSFSDCQARIQDLRGRLDQRARASRERPKAINKLRYKIKELDRVEDDGVSNVWRAIDEALGAFLAAGGSTKDKDLRAALGALLEKPRPDGVEPGPALAGALDDLAEERADEDDAAPARAPSGDVLAVRRRLQGTTLVIVGGVPKPKRIDAIREAFALGDLQWLTDGTFVSNDRFEPMIRGPKTLVVMMMVRWSRHAFEGVRHLCEKHGKLYLRLPAGYSPNQIAHQLLIQHPGAFGPGAQATA